MPDVVFCRQLRRGNVGNDVIAHKRAVSRWNPDVYAWHTFTTMFGATFEGAVKTFQRRHNLTVDGIIGKATHEALEKAVNKNGAPAFDALAVQLATDWCRDHSKTKEERIRDTIVSNALFYYSHRYQIAYSQTRPFPVRPLPYVPSRLDCSGLATICQVLAGAPNPNGNQPTGLGYTGTLMSSGHRVASVGDLEPGDFVFYGYSSGRPGFAVGDPTHVAVYVGFRDGGHKVVSNGSYPMRYAAFNYRHDINHYRAYNVAP